MLSYRKSQRVLLAEKLKIKNVIRVFGASGSGTTMARLCHSAFVRVATLHEYQYMSESALCHSAFVRVATHADNPKILPILNFATAHSRGLRRGIDGVNYNAAIFATAHSCGLRRIGASPDRAKRSLPQRIRAGCDAAINANTTAQVHFATAHSCGLRRF